MLGILEYYISLQMEKIMIEKFYLRCLYIICCFLAYMHPTVTPVDNTATS